MRELAKKIYETRACTIRRMHVVESVVSDFMYDYNLDQSNYYDSIEIVKSRLVNESQTEWIIDLLKELKSTCVAYATLEKILEEE